MKKLNYLLFSVILLLLSSCVIGTSNEGHLDDMLQGDWEINHEMRYASFHGNVFDVRDSQGQLEFNGTFTNDKMSSDPPMWVWEDSTEKISVTWNAKDTTGHIIYVDYLGNCDQKILVVSGFPFSKNSVDTLYQK